MMSNAPADRIAAGRTGRTAARHALGRNRSEDATPQGVTEPGDQYRDALVGRDRGQQLDLAGLAPARPFARPGSSASRPP
jgi:hypothetical protein